MNFSDSQKQTIFTWLFIIIYILYIVTFLGLVSINSQYISNARTIIETISCILLIIRFNPYVSHSITNFDKTMIFSVATFLLFNIVISELYLRYSSNPVVNTLGKLQIHKDISAN
jgi:hypothetical protein